MDTLVCHGYPMTPSSGIAFRCFWCKTGGYIRNGYRCFECDRWFHEECVSRWLHKDCGNPECRICFLNISYHPEHILRKFTHPFWRNFFCGWCGESIDDEFFYNCSVCDDFRVHISCSIAPPTLTIKHPQAHEHPLALCLVSTNPQHLCEACKENVVGKLTYICTCFHCEVVLHVECVDSPEVNHPCHPKHSLKLFTSGAPDYTDNTCLVCGLKLEGVLYHCSICNFSVCLGCTSIPPPIDVENFKTHEHKLTLIPRNILFTCNACGMRGYHSPYLCLQCSFMVHRSCIGLPRVININCHDHRISHIQQLGFEDGICEVCSRAVNPFYGAYICSVCDKYVVHSQCATKNDVWDGIELEGTPDEAADVTPFTEVGDDLINHISHTEHKLKLNKDGTTHGGSIRCEACVLPVYSEPVYSCEQCDFILHEICAKLPRKKLHMFHSKPFSLHVENLGRVRVCTACGDYFSGFRYESDNKVLDIRCILIPELHSGEELDHHTLYYNKEYMCKCGACHKWLKSGAVSCVTCEANFDFWCASLPKIVKHMYDQHPLSLSGDEEASGKYWCDICEEELDPKKWFYTCNDCEISVHVKCVLGDFSRLKPGRGSVYIQGKFIDVIPNNHSSRPICSICRLRCQAPFILKSYNSGLDYSAEKYGVFICSKRCLLMT